LDYLIKIGDFQIKQVNFYQN